MIETLMQSAVYVILFVGPVVLIAHCVLSLRINRVFDPDWPEQAGGPGLMPFSFFFALVFT